MSGSTRGTIQGYPWQERSHSLENTPFGGRRQAAYSESLVGLLAPFPASELPVKLQIRISKSEILQTVLDNRKFEIRNPQFFYGQSRT